MKVLRHLLTTICCLLSLYLVYLFIVVPSTGILSHYLLIAIIAIILLSTVLFRLSFYHKQHIESGITTGIISMLSLFFLFSESPEINQLKIILLLLIGQSAVFIVDSISTDKSRRIMKLISIGFIGIIGTALYFEFAAPLFYSAIFLLLTVATIATLILSYRKFYLSR